MAATEESLREELARLEAAESPREELERLEAAEAERQASLSPVDRSPFPLPPPPSGQRDFGPMLGKFPASADQFSPNERADAARGVDVKSDLPDFNLRKALGFSPNQAFTFNFLQDKLAEKTGLPREQVLQQNIRGEFEWLNPETGRYTPIDNDQLSPADLADLYGPTKAIGGSVIGSLTGGRFGGGSGATLVGAFGAFAGEMSRLRKGKELGVHDLSLEEMFNEATDLAKMDLAFGAGGQALVKLKKFATAVFRPVPFDEKQAKEILDGVGTHKDMVDDINRTLEEAGSARRFKLDPVADAEHALGLEQREAAAKLTNESKALRTNEITANQDALEEYARIKTGIKDTDSFLVTNEGAAQEARAASFAAKKEVQIIRAQANADVRVAEGKALNALEDFRGLETQAEQRITGAEARANLAAHQQVLKETKDDAWEGYQTAIGQSPTILKSSVKVPVNAQASFAFNRVLRDRKASLLKNKAQGPRALKKLKKGQEVDLAVLDSDIKELKALARRADSGFSGNKVREARDLLVKMRNDHLLKTDPLTLALLEEAEAATKIHSRFVNESAFARILKTNKDGSFVVDDVGAFKEIFLSGGQPIRELIDVAKGHPGGKAAIQNTVMKLYRANVIPSGQTIPSLDLHNKFVKDHADTLSVVFADPRMTSFGKLTERVQQAVTKQQADAVRVADSALAKIAGANPERMGKAVFREDISDAGVRATMVRLGSAGPEAVASMQQATGREIYRRLAVDGVNVKQMRAFLNAHGARLNIVMGEGFTQNLAKLAKAMELNAATETGKQLPTSTFIGRLARVIVAPPLTPQGHFQTLLEKARVEAGARILSEAVRDPKVLQAIIDNANSPLNSPAVASILAQIGGSTLLAIDDE